MQIQSRFVRAACILVAVILPQRLLAADLTASESTPKTVETKVDVLVYGGTPAGIAAALAAGRKKQRVLLIEPYRNIGGLITNGLSHADFRTFEGLSGSYLKFTRRVQKYYATKYGPKSPQAKGCFRGTHAEPHVNRIVFEKMLSEVPSIEVKRRFRLTSVKTTTRTKNLHSITTATFSGGNGSVLKVGAAIFIDATYEGDLMAAAGVPYRVGREAGSEYKESLAPAKADRQVQGYNFRLILTRDAKNRVPPTAPSKYRREEFLPLVPLLKAGKFKNVFVRWRDGIYKAHKPLLPNGKYDINDVSHGLVRLSLPDLSDAWPDGDAKTRRKIFAEHLRHNVGLLYFLQNDKSVPARFQKEAREWGFCKDEFPQTGHIPEQLYIREARRMTGRYIFTEKDTDAAPNDARAILRTDAIAMGDYGPNCHGTAHSGPRIGGRHTGEFYKRVAPYQIPYGVLLPKRCDNLLVPVACSSSHVGFCALRLEPIWMSLGEAAGFAAHFAVESKRKPADISVKRLQRELHRAGAATIYVSDVSPDSPDFAAVQWWGTHGGLHGLQPAFKKPGQRGELLTSQYYKAFPGHAVKLKQRLSDKTRRRWLRLAGSLKLPTGGLMKARTRGEFIRIAYKSYRTQSDGRKAEKQPKP